MDMTSLLGTFAECGVVAVVTLDDAGAAERTAEALLAGGIQAVELTLRT
ncbi:MAG: aldolase, partial [Verrucomicrobiota bacterium]